MIGESSALYSTRVRRRVHLEDGRAGGGDRVEHPGQQGREAPGVGSRHGGDSRIGESSPYHSDLSAQPEDIAAVPATPRQPSTAPAWSAIHTVCLDMDGTVLDLRFDNLFWLEALPRRWGERHGVPAEEAIAQLRARFDARRGTLEWYCIDHWSEELDFDIAALKFEMRAHIRYLPGALGFLEAVRALGKRAAAHDQRAPHQPRREEPARRDSARHFDELVSSHEFGVPKEPAEFWTLLGQRHAVDPATTLFVDDSSPVLEAARQAGVREIYQVLQPDSTQPLRAALAGITAIRSLADLVP